MGPLGYAALATGGNILAGLLGGKRRVDPQTTQDRYMKNYQDVLGRLPQLNTKGMYSQGKAELQGAERLQLGQQYGRFRKMLGPNTVATAELGAGTRTRQNTTTELLKLMRQLGLMKSNFGLQRSQTALRAAGVPLGAQTEGAQTAPLGGRAVGAGIMGATGQLDMLGMIKLMQQMGILKGGAGKEQPA